MPRKRVKRGGERARQRDDCQWRDDRASFPVGVWGNYGVVEIYSGGVDEEDEWWGDDGEKKTAGCDSVRAPESNS